MGVKIPRATISVRFFDEEETLELMSRGAMGERAVLLWFQILCLAKKLRNRGEFAHPIAIYASSLGISKKKANELLEILKGIGGEKPWVVPNETGGFSIRSWSKWNTMRDEEGDIQQGETQWGGPRPGAGRPRKYGNQVDIQDEYSSGIQDEKKESSPAPAPVAGSAHKQEENTKRGDADCAGESKASEQRATLNANALTRHGVQGVALSVLARHPDITPEIIDDESLHIADAEKPAGVLIARLTKRFNVTLPRGRLSNLTTDSRKAVLSIQQLRTTKAQRNGTK